jgi:CBS domain-containing protein
MSEVLGWMRLKLDFGRCFDELEETLGQVVCGSLINCTHEKPILLKSSFSVAEAAAILSANRISSAPVVDETSGTIQFSFDFRDICALVVEFLSDASNLVKVDSDVSFSFLVGEATLDTAKIVSGIDGSFVSVKESDSLIKAIGEFSKGTHRLAVVDETGSFVGVISQSDAIECIDSRTELLEPILGKTLEELGLARKTTITINWSVPVLEALKTMRAERVSSIGLIDEADTLAGVLSMTDVKHLFHSKSFGMLKNSCEEFVAEIRRTQEAGKKKVGYSLTVGLIECI